MKSRCYCICMGLQYTRSMLHTTHMHDTTIKVDTVYLISYLKCSSTTIALSLVLEVSRQNILTLLT